MGLTFDELAKGCTPEERDKLAFHLACQRLRRTYESLREEGGKRCFTYCGAACTCGAGSPPLPATRRTSK